MLLRACARNGAFPGPRDRGLGTRSWSTAIPAFDQAFERCRERPPLLSSSASKVFFQCFYAPTGERLRAGSTTSTRTQTTATTTSTTPWTTTPTSRRAASLAAACKPDRGLRRALAALPGPRRRPRVAQGTKDSGIYRQNHRQHGPGRGDDRGAGCGRRQGVHPGAYQPRGPGRTGSDPSCGVCASDGLSSCSTAVTI